VKIKKIVASSNQDSVSDSISDTSSTNSAVSDNGTKSDSETPDLKAYVESEKKMLTKIDTNLSNKLSGKILLQIEEKGEGWYINPANKKRYFLGRPADAFNIMRELGLGISNKDFDSFKGVAPKRLAGRILIKVEDSGKAYYVNPDNLKIYYLGRPADAFKVMRELGLGISNSNIRKIDIN
jgi:ribosomal protein L30/L7E